MTNTMMGLAYTAVGRCPCGGQYEPDTDGMGNVVDVCGRCGAPPGKGHPLATHLNRSIQQQWGTTMPLVTASNTGKPCPVNGCPGTIEATGLCPCCAKRQKFAEAHAPKATCPICGGPFRKKGRARTCKACLPHARHLANSTA